MKFAALSTFILASFAAAAPAAKRQGDLGVVELLEGVCDKIGGTMITQTVCQTVTGSDISVSAVNGGLAKVTVAGRGLLSGASITVPVGSLESVLGQLGFGKRDLDDRAIAVDLGGAGLTVRDLDERAIAVDLGGAGLTVRDFDDRAIAVDLGGAGLTV